MINLLARKSGAERAKIALEDAVENAISHMDAPEESPDLRARLGDAGSRIGNAGGRIGDAGSRIVEAGAEAARAVGSRIGDAGKGLPSLAHSSAARAMDAASSVPLRIQVGKPRRRPILPWIGLGVATTAVGAVLAYILDPETGRSRRATLRDRVAASARRVAGWSTSQGRRAAATATVVRERLRAPGPGEPADEVALVSRIKSELFRDPAIDKGSINVNAERDIVFLRGTAPSEEQVREIAERVEGIAGVRKVMNLLHLPGAPVPVMTGEEHEAVPPKGTVPH